MGEKKSKIRDIKTQIVKELIEFIRYGETPWEKPWITPLRVPINAVTNRSYRGINLIYLFLQQLRFKTQDPRWVTFLQAKSQGWRIKRGARGVPIVFYTLREKEFVFELDLFQDKFITLELLVTHYPQVAEVVQKYKKAELKLDLVDKNKVKLIVTYPVLVYHYVFHASQVEGIPPYKPQLYNFNPIPTYEKLLMKIVNSPKINIAYRDEASYAPVVDTVYMPLKEQFKTSLDFYATLLHELVHSTMHEKRLNRYQGDYTLLNSMEKYAIEELIAELGAFIVSIKVGLPFQPSQSYAYVKSWFLKTDLKFNALYKIVKEAEKAADWIISEYGLAPQSFIEEETEINFPVETSEKDFSEVILS